MPVRKSASTKKFGCGCSGKFGARRSYGSRTDVRSPMYGSPSDQYGAWWNNPYDAATAISSGAKAARSYVGGAVGRTASRARDYAYQLSGPASDYYQSGISYAKHLANSGRTRYISPTMYRKMRIVTPPVEYYNGPTLSELRAIAAAKKRAAAARGRANGYENPLRRAIRGSGKFLDNY